MQIPDYLSGWALEYAHAKQAVEGWTGAGQELLHVHAGLLIFVLTALLFRKKMRSAIPLAFVAFFASLNEIVDWMGGKPTNTAEPLADFANTMFWPCILFAIARRWR